MNTQQLFNVTKVAFLTTTIIVLPSQAISSETSAIDFVGGASLGYTRLTHPAKLDSKPTFASVFLSGAVAYEQWYLGINLAQELDNEALSEEEDTGDAGREDIDITLGYRIDEHWTVFAGYKDSETDIDFRERDGGPLREEYYRRDGFFVGGSYSFDLAQAGSISINAAYIDLSTDNRFLSDDDDDDDDDEIDLEEFDDLQGTNSGDAEGWSYGISWVIPLGEQLAFNASYKVNDYEEEIDFEGTSFTADQKVTFFNVGLLYIF